MFSSLYLVIAIITGSTVVLVMGNYETRTKAPKVKQELNSKLQNGDRLNIIVTFGPTLPTLRTAKSGLNSNAPERIRLALQKLAKHDQDGVVQILAHQNSQFGHRVHYEQLWISNRMYVLHVDLALVSQIALDPKVIHIEEEQVLVVNRTIHITEPKSTTNKNVHFDNDNFTWGIQKIMAPKAWEELGGADNAGAGVVVGIMDHGAAVKQEALRDNFLGNYGWFDPFNLSMNSPNDYSGLGSHIAGIAVSVAPGANLSFCRSCFSGHCPERFLDKCAEFFICPTLANGKEEDCSKSVDVVNISIGYFSKIAKFFERAIEAFHAVGIIPVVSAGDGGPACSSIYYPGSSPDVITVGSTDYKDERSLFTGIGATREGIFKPDVVAPGERIKSVKEDPEDPFMILSSTDCATAYVSGVVALLKSRDKGIGFEQVRYLLRANADKDKYPITQSDCGVNISVVPNPIYGWGRINAYKTIRGHTLRLENMRNKPY